ncbi:MAG: AI-2E family transporter [Anaerolineae bacterium]
MRRLTPWIVAIVALVFLFLIRSVLLPFILAIILAYILVPGVDALAERFRVRRLIVVAVLYVLFLILIGALVWWLRPTVLLEIRSLREDTVGVIERAIVTLAGGQQFELLGNALDAHELARTIAESLRAAFDGPTRALEWAQRLFEILTSALLMFISLFYLLLDWEKLIAFVFRFVPVPQRARAGQLVRDINKILGAYLRGQLILILFISSLTWIALGLFFHVPFAFGIAIATGFLEIIPLVGPVIAGGIAAVSALSTPGGANLAVAVIIFYTVLRQIEDQLIAPTILGRAVHVHPLAAIFAVVSGGAIAGPLGLVLGVPAAAAIKVILDAIQTPVSPEQLPIGEEPAPEPAPDKPHQE